jgi:hypothetical protein
MFFFQYILSSNGFNNSFPVQEAGLFDVEKGSADASEFSFNIFEGHLKIVLITFHRNSLAKQKSRISFYGPTTF